jgi:hypothetical protein
MVRSGWKGVGALAVAGSLVAFAVPAALASGSHHRKPVARAAAGQCEVYNAWIQRQPRGNSMVAQGLVGAECNPTVRYMFSQGSLQELWTSDGKWHTMAAANGGTEGANEWSWAYPTITCKDSNTRQWRLYGYVIVETGNGDYYTDEASNQPLYATLTCRA